MQRMGSVTRGLMTFVGLVAVLALSACTFNPMRPLPPRAASPVAVAPAPGSEMPAPDGMAQPADLTASGAEQACIAAGRERGLDVLGVVGSSAMTGSNGEATRDVMLRVRRDGAEIELRCNYVAETGMARIMLL